MTLLEFLAQNIVKASVLLAAAFAASWVLRNRAAALRHFVWTAAMAALLLLPFAIAVAPQRGWRTMPVKQTVAAVAHGSVRVSQAPAAPSSPRLPLLLLAWVAGFLAVGVRFARGAARTARMVRRATPAPAAEAGEMARGVRLLESAEAPMPLVWGIRRPAVVLPLEARGWPAERLRTVVLHERMHVERGDLVAQALGQAACCLYWFHPLVWLAARRLRTERERACDDAVLLRGVLAHDYAGHLLALVQSLAARKAGWASVAGMAESSGLESRVRALLDRRRRRHPLSRRAALAVSAAGLALILPLATLSTSAQVTRGGLAGVVKDPSGARVPGTDVTA
ncbi:MAG TPA: M56 family metallopeptidase, partial [Candidatus Sulfopaludibacter sp.]|nr:M56 family metallopeptidase [Candidatus Sulfopaludibacter sp.]